MKNLSKTDAELTESAACEKKRVAFKFVNE